MHFPNSELLQPPGVALRIEYSPTGDYLMVARTNINRGLVEIWPSLHSQRHDVSSTQPIAWKIFEHSLSDAAWSGDQQLTVCTHIERAWILRFADDLTQANPFTGESLVMHNLIERTVVIPTDGEVDTTYKHDNTHDIDVFFVRPYDHEAAQDQMVVYDSSLYDTDTYLHVKKTFALDWTFVTAAMQPVRQQEQDHSMVASNTAPTRLLATAAESGGCRLFELNRDTDGILCKPLFSDGGYTLKMSYGPALAVAWSPNGTYLAAAGTNLVQVWQISGSGSVDNRPVLTWRASRSSLDEVEHVNGLDRESSKPICLAWDAESEKICFTVDSKVTIIELELSEIESANAVQPL